MNWETQRWTKNVITHVGPQGLSVLLHEKVPCCRKMFWGLITLLSVGYTLTIVGVNYKDFSMRKTIYEINVIQGELWSSPVYC